MSDLLCVYVGPPCSLSVYVDLSGEFHLTLCRCTTFIYLISHVQSHRAHLLSFNASSLTPINHTDDYLLHCQVTAGLSCWLCGGYPALYCELLAVFTSNDHCHCSQCTACAVNDPQQSKCVIYCVFTLVLLAP